VIQLAASSPAGRLGAWRSTALQPLISVSALQWSAEEKYAPAVH
jgi:hypothetical protein